jgi:hypothetical protein
MGGLEIIWRPGPMLTVQNTITIKFGNNFEGSAEGPLGIGALLAISLLVATIFRRRKPPP